MKRESTGPILTTVFVDYDNIYLSLKRKNDDAAKRFAKDCGQWLQAIVSGELITPTSAYAEPVQRRIAIARCYGNSHPRRNAHDNSTDMNSFPFIKQHFLRSGFEIVDCPSMTAQMKNAADIRIVLDAGDILAHPTFFDEIIILSGDADFTPMLHRLRAYARRTVIFAYEHTAQPYTAISDGEIRESDLIALLLNQRAVTSDGTRELAAPQSELSPVDVEAARRSILSEVVSYVRSAPRAVPLETLADRAVRVIGRDKTVETQWTGFTTFRDLLLAHLPEDLHLSDTPPYTVFDGNRHITSTGLLAPQPPVQAALPAQGLGQTPPLATEYQPAQQISREAPRARPPQQQAPLPAQRAYAPAPAMPAPQAQPQQARREPEPLYQQPAAAAPAPQRAPQQQQPVQQQAPKQQPAAPPTQQPAPYGEQRRPPARPQQQAPLAGQPRTADQATQIQQSIARIHEACQAPALAPAEYRVLFDIMAQEITANGLQGGQTLVNLTQRAREFGLDLKRDDLRFILEVVSESDPWFEQGVSPNLFASRFRNFVVARCRSQGLSLSSDELDLVEAWFSSQQPQPRAQAYGRGAPPPQQAAAASAPAPAPQQANGAPVDRWWNLEEGRQHIAEQRVDRYAPQEGDQEDEFPRIVRSRLRG